MKTLLNTIVKKLFHGWLAETYLQHNDTDYKVTTMKRHSGQIKCIAHSGKLKKLDNGFVSFTSAIGQDRGYELLTSEARATRKTIAAIHETGLDVFDRCRGALPVRKPQKQIV